MGRKGSTAQPGGLLGLASQESDEIVIAAAARIHRVVAETEHELRTLKATVDAAADLVQREAAHTREATPTPLAAPMLPASASAHLTLDAARTALDELLAGISRPVDAPARMLRFRMKPMLLGGAATIVIAAGLGLATGWLSAGSSAPMDRTPLERRIGTSGTPTPDRPHSGSGSASSAPTEQAPDSDAALDPVRGRSAAISAAPAATGGPDLVPAAVADELRQGADTWLRAYFERRASPASQRAGGPVVRDERRASDRLPSTVSRRTITPARVDVFGDAAVLSASVTEYPAGVAGREVVLLVSQLWTRKGGRWHLDDVRIVSADNAEHAFRR